ncbi:MAG: hypothetical protein IJF41_07090 [Clostridia bacterium]|nr:hypothetical protein [Clostridia bacterium]
MIDLSALWTYQAAEQKLADAENAVRSTPNRVKLNQLHRFLKNQQQIVAKLNEEVAERAKQFARLSEQIQKLEEQLSLEQSELENMQQDEESTAEEMTELRQDIEKLGREMNASMRDIKTIQQSVEKALADYQSTGMTYKKAKKEYDQLRAVCEQEKEAAAGEIKALTEELEKLGKDVEPALLARYQKARLHNTNAIAKVVQNKCGGCNMSLPTFVLKKLSGENAIVECENCGRILYIEE